MKKKRISEMYTLNEQAVDDISLAVQNFLKECGLEKRNITGLRLSVENILLDYLEHFGAGKEVSVSLGSHYGSPSIIIELEGEEFNPVKSNDDFDEISASLYSRIGFFPVYNYQKGKNSIQYKLQKKAINPSVLLLIAFVSAVVLGLIGLKCPEMVRTTIDSLVLTPINNVILGILSSVAGPMVFLSVAWGIYGIGDSSVLGKIGKTMLARIVSVGILFSAIGTFVAMPFFHLNYTGGGFDVAGVAKILDMLTDIVPNDIVNPFANVNTLQIIAMALVVGVMMLVLEKQTKVVAKFFEQISLILDTLMGYVSKVIPFLIFIMVLKLVWSDSLPMLATAWKPVVLLIVTVLVLTFSAVGYFCIKMKVNMFAFLKKVFPAFLIAFSTSSSGASLGACISCLEKDLGVDHKFTMFSLPISIVLSKPLLSAGFAIYILYLAEQFNVAASSIWIITLIIMAAVVSSAMPPIPGGAIAAYSLIFTQLGIPDEALALVLILDVLLDFMSTGFCTITRTVEIVLNAEKAGMLDKEQFYKLNKKKV